MKKLILLLASLSLLGMFAFGDEKEVKKGEKKDETTKVELKDVPKAVLDAAKEKVKGFEAKSAATEMEDGVKEYKLKGSADGKEIELEVKVDKDGKVTKVEIEDHKKDKKEGDGDGD